MELVSMTCRNCGGKLQINKDAGQILCQNCGTEYLVSINEGAISIKLLSQGLEKISVATDKTAAELGLVRLRKEKDRLITDFGNISTSISTEAAQKLISDVLIKVNKGVYPFNPSLYRMKCEAILDQEQKKFVLFRNLEYMNDLNAILFRLKLIEKQYLEIIKEEEHFIGVVKQK